MSDTVQAFQNFQMPAGAAWQVAPTVANIDQGLVPSLISIDPSMYSDVFNSNDPQLNTYTDPKSGQSVPVNPWNLDPRFQQGGQFGEYNPLIVSPAIPGPGGTEDLKAGTYSDPTHLSGAGETTYNYNLNTGTATPTEQSLEMTYNNFINHQIPGWGRFLMGLPQMAFMSLIAPGVAGALAGSLGAAGASAGTSLLSGLGSLGGAGGGSGLLGDLSSAYQAVKPALTIGQDALKIGQAVDAMVNPPQAPTQAQAFSLLNRAGGR